MSVVLIRLKIREKAQPPLGGFLYLGLSTRASLFWAGSGHGCGNGGIYHPPGSGPNGQFPTWVKLGSYWVGEQAGESTNISRQPFCSEEKQSVTIMTTHDMTVLIVSCDRDLSLKNELRWDQIKSGAAVFSPANCANFRN